jgi:hypothetical protein
MMKKIYLLIAIASLSACAPHDNRPQDAAATPPPASPVTSPIVTAGTKALIEAEAAYIAAGNAMILATQVHMVKGEVAARVQQINNTVMMLLDAGHKAQTEAVRLTTADQIKTLVAELVSLTPAR